MKKFSGEFAKNTHQSLVRELHFLLVLYAQNPSEYSIRQLMRIHRRPHIFGAAAACVRKLESDPRNACKLVIMENGDLEFSVGPEATETQKYLVFFLNNWDSRLDMSNDAKIHDPNSVTFEKTSLFRRHERFIECIFAMLPREYTESGTKFAENILMFATDMKKHYQLDGEPLDYDDEFEGQIGHKDVCNNVIQLCNTYLDAFSLGPDTRCAPVFFNTEKTTIKITESKYLFENTPLVNPLLANTESITRTTHGLGRYFGLMSPTCGDRAMFKEVRAASSQIPPCFMCNSRNILFVDDMVSVVERIPADTKVRDYSEVISLPEAVANSFATIFGVYRANLKFDEDLEEFLGETLRKRLKRGQGN